MKIKKPHELQQLPPLNTDAMYQWLMTDTVPESEKQERERWLQAVEWIYQITHEYSLYHGLFYNWRQMKVRIYTAIHNYLKQEHPALSAIDIERMERRIKELDFDVTEMVKLRPDHSQLPENMQLCYEKALQYKNKVAFLRAELDRCFNKSDAEELTQPNAERAKLLRQLNTAYKQMKRYFEYYDSVKPDKDIQPVRKQFAFYKEKNKKQVAQYEERRTAAFKRGAAQSKLVAGTDMFNPPKSWKGTKAEWQKQCIMQYNKAMKKAF